MEVGFLSMNHIGGIAPAALATELEDRGYDSIWVPEHSHIPVSRDSPYPGGGELPNAYWHMMDPFVSLATAAQATERIKLATGICLILEHDLLDLACTVATLDALSGGRVLLGIGVGWNEEEFVNHRPDVPFRKRFSAQRERVAALRTIWTEDEPSFDGTYDRFTASWVYPKPAQGTVPIALGNAGPVGITHAAEYADHWCPIDASLFSLAGGVEGGITTFRQLADEAGRDGAAIPISLFVWGNPKPARLAEYQALGVERIVLSPPTMSIDGPDQTLPFLDGVEGVLCEFRG